MIRINLLPHREQKRKARQQPVRRRWRDRLAVLGVAVVGAGALVILAAQIENQQQPQRRSEDARSPSSTSRSRRSTSCASRPQALLARKQVVETLQTNRTEAVHLLDQLVRQLPDGVYLKSVKQIGAKVDADRLRAVERARLDADAQHREPRPGSSNPELVEIKAVHARRQDAGQRVHPERSRSSATRQ